MSFTITCRPTANGTYQQFQYQNPSGYYHYQKVYEVVADGSTTYIKAQGLTKLADTFQFSKPTPQGRIVSVTVVSRCASGGNGNEAYLSTALYHPSHSIKYGTESYLYPTGWNWTNLSTVYSTNPWTSSPWTWDDIDDLEFGAACRCGNASHVGVCTQTYLIIEWDYVIAAGGAQIIGLELL